MANSRLECNPKLRSTTPSSRKDQRPRSSLREDRRVEYAVEMERLQKILSQAGVASRRASEQLMLEGRVTVNGTTARELGTKADPLADDIRVDGRRIRLPEGHRYLLLNKPRGYVTTRADPQRRPTVLDLLGGVREYVYPVGRLDFDSEGLLLLTNDGELAARLTHPSHGVPRVYEVRVAGVPDPRDLERLARGVTIDGRRTERADVQLVGGRGADRATVRITIHEGRNRQVRKMFDTIGHPVDELRRTAIGPIHDGRLPLGRWRDLSAAEVAALKRAAARVVPPNTPSVPRTPRTARARVDHQRRDAKPVRRGDGRRRKRSN
jgi:pseudouridine synthase